jgi:hypothetical protein
MSEERSITDAKILAKVSRYYPHPAQAEIPTVVVLVAGDIGDYAAYIGHGEPQWVASWGNKIGFREAKALFLEIEKEKYRL